MINPGPPIPESYWVIPGQFLAGEYPGRMSFQDTSDRLRALLMAGVDTFIDLTSPEEHPPYKSELDDESAALGLSTTYWRFPIDDFGLPTHDQMEKILDAIDDALSGGHKIYLHCWGGIGRTGTSVGCHLVRRGKSGLEALQQLAEWWRAVPKSDRYLRSPETDAQRQFIMNWNELA
jgi:predicted protein tyrosine phosphatase